MRRKQVRRTGLILALAGLLPAVIFSLLIVMEPLPVRAWRDLVFDGYQRISPRPYDLAQPVRVVAIDDESLDRVGRWPWSRETLAQLLRKLGDAKAAAVAFDVIFSEAESSADGDARLAEAIGAAPTVLGFAGADRGAAFAPKGGFAVQGDDPRLFVPKLTAALLPIRDLQNAAAGLGSINLFPDRDLIVREIPTLISVGGALAPSMSIEALRVAQAAGSMLVRASNASGETAFGNQTGITALRVGDVVVPTGPRGGVRIRFSGTHPERHIPAWKVLDGSADETVMEGAILLVGATATAIPDFKATPLEAAVPGIDIHAEMIEGILTGNHLVRPDYFRGLEALLAVLGSLLAAGVAARFSAFPAAAISQGMVALIVGASYWAFLKHGMLADPLAPALSTFVSFALAAVIVSRDTDQEKQRIRDAFSRYMSPAMIEVLARDPGRLALGGEIKPLTLLFSDIRGFTSLSETMPAQEVVRFLNEIHTPLTEHVLASGGTLDKFMGDGMMAFWNAPLDHPDHVRAALRTALAMQASIVDINDGLAQRAAEAGIDHRPLAIGIGVHTGLACIGNIGSVRRFDYSAIGDSVNATARIEPLCKTYGVPILVSADIVEAAPDFAYLLADLVQLRGRQQETRIFTLHGDETAVNPEFAAFKARHDRAVTLAILGHPSAADAIDEVSAEPIAAPYRQLYAVLRKRAMATAPAAQVSASA